MVNVRPVVSASVMAVCALGEDRHLEDGVGVGHEVGDVGAKPEPVAEAFSGVDREGGVFIAAFGNTRGQCHRVHDGAVIGRVDVEGDGAGGGVGVVVVVNDAGGDGGVLLLPLDRTTCSGGRD